MVNLMPMPNCIEKLRGSVSFSNYQIIVENKYENAVLLFNKELEERLLISEDNYCYLFEFVFNKTLQEEQYVIHMDKSLTHIEAGSEKAFFYATRTLSQLFNLKNKRKVKKLTSKAYYIDDKPRFSYRSFMLDEVRHFFGVEQVKKYICMLSDLKINTFHWHLSDDQGFRIDFQTFPKLKEVASKRNKTKINSTENDDWDYELVDKDAVGLKPQQFNRYGYLVIDKKLADYNVTNPSAVFVFEVAAKKAGELVFNDVVAIDFAGVGSDSVKVGPIVAGAEVTVKEVYQGAGYEQLSVQPEGSQIIVANTYWDDCDDYREASKKSMESLPVVDKTVTLQNKTFVKYTFTNQHNDVPNGGTGVVNTFTVEETATEGKFIWDASQEFQGQTSVESEKTQ